MAFAVGAGDSSRAVLRFRPDRSRFAPIVAGRPAEAPPELPRKIIGIGEPARRRHFRNRIFVAAEQFRRLVKPHEQKILNRREPSDFLEHREKRTRRHRRNSRHPPDRPMLTVTVFQHADEFPEPAQRAHHRIGNAGIFAGDENEDFQRLGQKQQIGTRPLLPAPDR